MCNFYGFVLGYETVLLNLTYEKEKCLVNLNLDVNKMWRETTVVWTA